MTILPFCAASAVIQLRPFVQFASSGGVPDSVAPNVPEALDPHVSSVVPAPSPKDSDSSSPVGEEHAEAAAA